MIQRIRKTLVAIETVLLGVFLSVMVLSVFLQVITRLLHVSISWSEELARFSMVWAALIGAALALERGSMHRIDLLAKRLPARMQRALGVLVDLVVAALIVTLIWKGAAWALRPYVRVQVSSALEISMSWVYAAVPVSGVLMLLSMLLKFCEPTPEASDAGEG